MYGHLSEMEERVLRKLQQEDQRNYNQMHDLRQWVVEERLDEWQVRIAVESLHRQHLVVGVALVGLTDRGRAYRWD